MRERSQLCWNVLKQITSDNWSPNIISTTEVLIISMYKNYTTRFLSTPINTTSDLRDLRQRNVKNGDEKIPWYVGRLERAEGDIESPGQLEKWEAGHPSESWKRQGKKNKTHLNVAQYVCACYVWWGCHVDEKKRRRKVREERIKVQKKRDDEKKCWRWKRKGKMKEREKGKKPRREGRPETRELRGGSSWAWTYLFEARMLYSDGACTVWWWHAFWGYQGNNFWFCVSRISVLNLPGVF